MKDMPKFKAVVTKQRIVVIGGSAITTNDGHYVLKNRQFTNEEHKAISKGDYASGRKKPPADMNVTLFRDVLRYS